jgi:SAM-dependent methyltransferase
MGSYKSQISKEIETFEANTNVHDLPQSAHYANNKILAGLLQRNLGVNSFPGLILKYYKLLSSKDPGKPLEMASLGSGNCDFEVSLVADNKLNCVMTCYELNPAMLERGKALAESRGVDSKFRFVACDINALKLDRTYDIVIANHSLHHFVGLEHVFAEVHEHLHANSLFIVNDMIGRNGHMFWPEALDFVNRLWSMLPKPLKQNYQLEARFPQRVQWDCSNEGFEGVRAQDILPLLDQTFRFRDFAPFAPILNRFTDRDFGPNFRTEDPLHKAYLDLVCELDHYLSLNHLMRPTQLIGSMMRKDADIGEYRYIYFETPSAAYNLDESKFYAAFDKDSLGGEGELCAGLAILDWGPRETRASTSFNVQPDGTSAFWIRCDALAPTSVIVLDGKILPSAVALDGKLITAAVPKNMDGLFATPGRFPIWIRDVAAGSESDKQEFVVTKQP